MTFTELMSLLNGNYIEVAGTDAKNQCVDLANAYIKYVLGLPIIEWTNAVDFPSKAGDQYEWIQNTPTGVPSEGDLVIWGGTYGHVGIFIEGNATRFTSFDENYPLGSPCRPVEHTYLSPKVLGWLHPKVVLSDLQTQLDQCRKERDDNHNDRMSLYEELGFTSLFNRIVAVEEIKKLKGIEAKSNEKDEQLKELRLELDGVKEELRLARTKIGELEDKLLQSQTSLEKLKNQLEDTTDKIEQTDKKIDSAIRDNPTFWEKIKKWFMRF